MSPAVMTPAEMITEVWILRGTAEGIQKAAEAAEDDAQKTTLSQEDKERELRVAGLLIESCQKLTEGVVSIWDRIRAFIRAGELGPSVVASPPVADGHYFFDGRPSSRGWPAQD